MASNTEQSEEEGSLELFHSAHISPHHISQIRDRIKNNEYDIIAIELDENRFQSLAEKQQATSMSDIVENLDGIEGVMKLLLFLMQRYQAQKLGIEPGTSDMRAATEEAAVKETPVALIDQDFDTTLERFREETTIVQDLIEQLISGSPEDFKMDEEDQKFLREIQQGFVEDGFDTMTDQDTVRRVKDIYGDFAPSFIKTFLDERDEHMAQRLHELRKDGQDVFVVIGAMHGPGIEERLEEYEEEDAEFDVDIPIKEVVESE